MVVQYKIQERENFWQEFWEKEGIYRFNPKSKKPVFSIDTPPPYISAEHLHIGHVMSYSQADFIARFKRMSGFEVFYPMGFDDNGLPTERFVEKKYKVDKSKISRQELIKLCLKETEIGIEKYKNLWRMVGISVDWTKTYSTIGKLCQKISQWSFIDLYKKGKVIQKEEPIYWCPNCQTAVSQADLEDKEEKSSLHYVKFKTQDNQGLVVATTRPEFLPACLALFFHPKDKRYIKLKNKKAIVPLFGYSVPIMASRKVKMDFGTGIEMVCSFGDSHDVEMVKEYQLPSLIVIDKKGRLNQMAGEFAGLKILQARQAIIEKLKEKKLLVKEEPIIHWINSHERCSTPIEFLKTKQWFIKILEIKKELLKQAKKMEWFPKKAKRIYFTWVKNLKWDWCISRQRYYGVSFPLWYCKNCQEVILSKMKELPVEPLRQKPSLKQCPKCKGKEFIPEKDVMDTWMTSSLTPLIISKLVKEKKIQEKLFPSTLRPQAFEIIRTWLFYSVLKALYHFKKIPFFQIMISGHGLDPQGRKISKRLGNYIPPENILKKYGADALRYWATSASLGENLRYNEKEIKRGKRTVIKLWNASHFCFSHFSGKNYSSLTTKNLEMEDRWILTRLQKTIEEVTKNLENYEPAKARRTLEEFFWKDFCDQYLEFVKPRLYCQKPDNGAKKALYRSLLDIIKMYSPFLPFLAEEIFHLYFIKFEKGKSVHLLRWPKANSKIKINSDELAEFNRVLKIISEIRKYKATCHLSQGAELEEFKAKGPLSEDSEDFIKRVSKVKNLKKV